MSTNTGANRPEGEGSNDLPTGRPVNEQDHRTLGERLTGRGNVPDTAPAERTAYGEGDRETATAPAGRGRHEAYDQAADAPVEETGASGSRSADTQAVPAPGARDTDRRGEEARRAELSRDDVRRDDTRPVDTRAVGDERDVGYSGRTAAGYTERPAVPDRHSVIARQKEDFGGVKIGAGFFGWLAATGLAVLLTALVAAVGAQIGVTDANLDEVTRQASDNLGSIGLAGGIALLVIIVVSYYVGGYVAGRMARFNGIRQGLVVWLWAIVIAAIVAGAAALWGPKYDILSTLNSFPRWPVDQGTLTTGGIIVLIILALASLIGALLGGLAGMYYHRRVDKVGLPD
ncbi:hypothetical protein [Segeticoccus rhizosphaerae]|uniref:hypothetical protein n=1 Tax=Segeticoccus rhizosphaerae TaxID=1104777 RepID=UPI001264B81C|nr:hypothetical protein [Segeticoccus rhizosphaerae]